MKLTSGRSHGRLAVALVVMALSLGLTCGAADAAVRAHARPASKALLLRTLGAHPDAVAHDQARPLVGLGLAGAGSVTGVVEDYDGNVIAGATVSLYHFDAVADGYVFDASAETGADGSFTITGAPATSEGVLDVTSIGAYEDSFGVTDLTFSDPGTTDVGTLRPGGLSVEAVEGGPWAGSALPTIETNNLDDSYADRTFDTESSWPTTFRADAMPGSVYDAICYFYYDEAAEWIAASGNEYAVSAGATTGSSVVLRESQALRSAQLLTGYSPSGKPGSKVKILIGNWPAGSTATFSGRSDKPGAAPRKSFGSMHPAGTGWYLKTVTVPTTATPGYAYWISIYRTDLSGSWLSLSEYFQVCTLKASAATIHRGGRVKLSGVIPTKGHWGTTAGKRKVVYVYASTKAKPQPTTWKPNSSWHLVAKVTANGLGKYASAYLRPAGTRWYVVRYPSDNWYWGGYTSVIKVTVR